MKYLAIIALLIIVLSACQNTESVKVPSNYPTDSIRNYKIGILDAIENRWLNVAYIDYKYKSQFEKGFQLIFDLNDPKVNRSFYSDSLSFAKYLLAKLRKSGKVHFVAQRINGSELTIYFYSKSNEETFADLSKLVNSNRITYKYEIDPDWKTFDLLCQVIK